MANTDDFFPEDDSTPARAPVSPGAPTGGGAANMITLEAAPLPAGILRSYVKAIKMPAKIPNKIIVELQPDEGVFAKSEPVSVWFDQMAQKDIIRLKTWAGVLGVPVTEVNGRITFDINAFVKKPCRAMYVPWHKKDGSVEAQVAKWAPNPDPNQDGHSPEFHAWAVAHSLSYDTLAGSTGIMPLTQTPK
jgi:hypothetical protein